MNSRRPKVWQTEDEILAAIDHSHRQAARLRAEESELRKESAELFGELERIRIELMQTDVPKARRNTLESKERHVEISASKKRAEAEAKEKAYARTMDKTLPRLGEVLAAFRTQTMTSILDQYRGVAIR